MELIPVENESMTLVPVENQSLVPVTEEVNALDRPRPTLGIEGVRKISPLLFTASVDTLYSMAKGAIGFPVHISSFLLGGVEGAEEDAEKDPLGADIGWDYDKAVSAFNEVGVSIGEWSAPKTEEGKMLHDWILGNVEWLGNAAGKLVQEQAIDHGGKLLNTSIPAFKDATGADMLGALTAESLKMGTFILGMKGAGKVAGKPLAAKAGEIKALRGKVREAEAKGQIAEAKVLIEDSLYETKADLVGAFKEAAKAGDKKTMGQIIELQKGLKFNAAEIPEGTRFPLMIPEVRPEVKPQTFREPILNKKTQAENSIPHEALWLPKRAEGKTTTPRLTMEGKLKAKAEELGITYEGRKAGKPTFTAVLNEKPVRFSPLEGETLEAALTRVREPYKEEAIFIATDNIKEIQKDLERPTEPTEQPTEFKNVQERMDYIKKKNEEIKKMEADGLYEPMESKDLLTIDNQGIIQEAQTSQMFRSGEVSGTPITLGEVKSLAEGKELGFITRMNSSQALEMIVKGKDGTEKVFTTLTDAKEYVKSAPKDSVKADKIYYEQKRVEIDKAPELIDKPVDTVKPIKKPKPLTETEIDFTMPIRNSESPLVPRLELLYDKKTIERMAVDQILSEVETTGRTITLSSKILPIKPLILEIEGRTGIPLFDSFMKIQDGIRTETRSSYKYQKRLNDSCKGLNLMNRERVYKFLESPIREEGMSYRQASRVIKADKELNEKFAGLTKKEFEAAGSIRRILNEAGKEYDIPLERMITDYAPRIRTQGISAKEAVSKWKLPEEYKWWAEEERSGYLMPHEEDIRKVVQSYINRGARKKYIGEEIEKVSKLVSEEQSRKNFTPTEAILLEKFVSDVRGWPSGMDDAMGELGTKLARALNKGIEATTLGLAPKRFENIAYKKVEKPVTIKGKEVKIADWEETGREPGFFDIQHATDDFINWHLSLTYGGALGFKPMAVIRNTIQPWITVLPVVGARDFAVGMKRAMTKEGWNECKANGIFMDDYMPLPGELTMLPNSFLTKAAYVGLKPYKMADSMNRAIAYHSMKSKVMRNGETYLKKIESLKNPEDAVAIRKEFFEKSDIEFFHPVLIKNEVMPLLKAKDLKSLSERLGRHMAENTQWVYRRANSPYFCRGRAGKLFGQFGTWPAWYLDYMKTIATRGSKANRAKRLATWGTVNAGIGALGAEVFGVDLNRYLWAGPFSWFGGIAVSSAMSMRNLIYGSDYEKKIAQQRLVDLPGMHIPGYLEMKSIHKAGQETDQEDVLKRLLGFTPSKE